MTCTICFPCGTSSSRRRYAAGRRSRGDVEPVRAALEAFRQEGASTERLVELDIAFHRALVEFGASRFLLSAWLALAPVLQAVITIGNRRLARRDPASHYRRILAAHEPILDPLARFDAEPVVRMLAEQFELTRAQFFQKAAVLAEGHTAATAAARRRR